MSAQHSEVFSVGDGILAPNASWSFGADVPKSFVEHVRRSVPLYDLGHDLVCELSDFFVHDGSVGYELGVSTGELLGKLAQRSANKRSRWVGLDVEESMIAEARIALDGMANVELHVGDAVLWDFESADMIVSYYCLQFVPPKLRQSLTNKIYESLNWGGCFVLFEKVRACDARFQDVTTSLYQEFKLKQRFTPAEIVAKSRSLKGVLEPFSTQGNIDMLKRAGFVDVMSIMKYVSFEAFLAIK
jgi:tRNA (cmo5U34)-methyltransferase